MKKKNIILLSALLLFLAGSACFLSGLRHDFLINWDDGKFIVHNQYLTFTWDNFCRYGLKPFQDLYTPLPMYSFMIDQWIAGKSAFFCRCHNLLLHIISAIFLFLIIRRTGADEKIAFLSSLLWMIHPQKVESVIWITERKDVLCGALAFASFYFYLRARTKRKVSIASGILAGLSIFAKPASIALPVLMLFYELCMLRKKSEGKTVVKKTFFPFIAVMTATVWAGIITAQTNPGELQKNILVPLSNLFRYPLTALFPYELNAIHPAVYTFDDVIFPLTGGLVLAAGLIAVMKYLKIGNLKIFLCFAAVGACAFPVLGFLDYTSFHFCDRYNYLVSAVVWGILAIILTRLLRKHRGKCDLLFVFLLLTGGVYAFQTQLYIPAWKNDLTLTADLLLRPGKPNLKLIALTSTVAMKYQKPEFFRTSAELFRKNEHFYPETLLTKEQKVFSRIFFEGELKIQEGDLAGGLETLRPLHDIFLQGRKMKFATGDYSVLRFLFRAAMLAGMEHRDRDELYILETEYKFRKMYDFEGGRFHLCAARIAELKGDMKTSLSELEKAIPLYSENPLLKQQAEILREKLKKTGVPKVLMKDF